jgi:ABC-type antimicrobial peptide transport system permease subunit
MPSAGSRGETMFTLRYAWNELRRRWKRTVVTALGLAAGVALVVGIIGVSNGLTVAQNSALSPLSSVGTDLVVTRTVAPTGAAGASGASSTTGGSSTTTTTTPGAGGNLLKQGASFFGGGAGNALSKLNAQDDAAVIDSNASILTDLSKLGPAGTKFTHDFFVPGTLITFPQAAVHAVASVKDVESAVPALSMQAQHETGTVPTITDTIHTGGQTIDAIQNLPPLTAAQGQAILSCITSTPGALQFFAGGGPTSSADLANTFDPLLQKCLPASYQQFVTQVVVPALTINEVINPPSTNTETSSYSVSGVDPTHPDSGLVTKAQLASGSWFGTDPTNQILVNTAYASTKGIKVGGHVTIDNTTFTVVGLVNPSLTGNASDIYFPLATLQSLSSSPARVNEVLVKVSKSADVGGVASAIRRLLPGAQVLTDKSLDDKVTGSIANAHTLASRFGGALAVVILLATFLIAVLLTLSNVNKRVREIGTLRAVGWSRRRVVRQILTETTGIGLLGAALGLALGIAVCAAVGAFGPSLASTTSGSALSASVASGLFHQATQGATSSTIQLTAPINASTILLGVLFALVGGLVAGLSGGWRAARLSPASALQDLG